MCDFDPVKYCMAAPNESGESNRTSTCSLHSAGTVLRPVPPWIVPMVLNQNGDALLSGGSGDVEGRAAFFDLSLDGRWGGVITGDKISLSFDACACGNASPSIRDDIVRYADLEGDDKIGCAGTVDAYVRGVS